MTNVKGGGKTASFKPVPNSITLSLAERARSRDKKAKFLRKMAATKGAAFVLDESHPIEKWQNSSLSGAHGEYVGTWPFRQNPDPDGKEPATLVEMTMTEPHPDNHQFPTPEQFNSVGKQITDFVSAEKGPFIREMIEKFPLPTPARFNPPAPTPHHAPVGLLAQRRQLEKQYRILYQQASRRKKLALKEFAKTNDIGACLVYGKRLHFTY